MDNDVEEAPNRKCTSKKSAMLGSQVQSNEIHLIRAVKRESTLLMRQRRETMTSWTRIQTMIRWKTWETINSVNALIVGDTSKLFSGCKRQWDRILHIFLNDFGWPFHA